MFVDNDVADESGIGIDARTDHQAARLRLLRIHIDDDVGLLAREHLQRLGAEVGHHAWLGHSRRHQAWLHHPWLGHAGLHHPWLGHPWLHHAWLGHAWLILHRLHHAGLHGRCGPSRKRLGNGGLGHVDGSPRGGRHGP